MSPISLLFSRFPLKEKYTERNIIIASKCIWSPGANSCFGLINSSNFSYLIMFIIFTPFRVINLIYKFTPKRGKTKHTSPEISTNLWVFFICMFLNIHFIMCKLVYRAQVFVMYMKTPSHKNTHTHYFKKLFKRETI